jgi:NADP-dependent 3-hydroxy acid dehydrogenase YdfG
MESLENKTAFVTGSTSGIGKSVARLLAQKKCNLICTSRETKKLEMLKKEIPEAVSFLGYECNFSNENDLISLMDKLRRSAVKIDILIHSAGIIKTNAVLDATLNDYNSLFDINIKAPFLITKYLLPKLKENNGQVVFINSSVVQRAIPNLGLYSATKFALKGFSDCLRQEINESSVRVITIYPGKTATSMQQRLYANKDYNPEILIQPEDIASIIINTLELPGTAEVTDIYVRPFIKS